LTDTLQILQNTGFHLTVFLFTFFNLRAFLAVVVDLS
jgi:hypothetical protein